MEIKLTDKDRIFFKINNYLTILSDIRQFQKLGEQLNINYDYHAVNYLIDEYESKINELKEELHNLEKAVN